MISKFPPTAEIVLEGHVHLDELRTEGPFGDHTGFYSLEDLYPVFHVSCITHRKNPIYSTTIVGKPPMEDGWMGKAVERIFLPLMRLTIPELVDINLPVEGVFHNLMLVSIRKSYPGQARKVMNAIWSLGQAMFTKCIIVVDEDVNVQDIGEVTLKVLNHIDPERDIQFTLGPVDSLDHSSRLPNYGSKMGIDATRKWPSEGFARPWPDEILMDEKTKALVDKKVERPGPGVAVILRKRRPSLREGLPTKDLCIADENSTHSSPDLLMRFHSGLGAGATERWRGIHRSFACFQSRFAGRKSALRMTALG